MNTVRAITALAALAGSSAFAQLSTLPPPSTDDGVSLQDMGMNAGATHWEDPSTLGAYRIASDGTVPVLSDLSWSPSAPASVWSALSAINGQGGTIRAIFTGETAGWYNDFGYTYSGSPSGPDSFTVLEDIQAVPPPNVTFGQYIDIALLAGEAATFDFWLNGTDSFTTANPSVTDNGGVYTAIRPMNSSPYVGSGNVRWSDSPLMVNTWLTSTGSYQDVATWLVSFEDWRLDSDPWDLDYSDFLFAVQLYDQDGNPFGNNPIPEPSTYGLIGAAALLGLAAWRRRKAATAK